jgi:hypothetical protein
MHIVIYLINYDLGFAIYMYLYLGVMILLFAQCIDRDRLTLPSLHGKQACLLWVWVLLVRVADHALQREAEQGVAVWDACRGSITLWANDANCKGNKPQLFTFPHRHPS